MKPKSHVKLDIVAFQKMKRIMPGLLAAKRRSGADVDVPELPEEVGLKLTNRCNLRCAHCFQWNDEGHHHDMPLDEQRRDLDFSIIEQVFAATHAKQSNIYIWGGEPLLYRDWNRLAQLLARDPRWTAICSNGLLVERRLASILPMSDRLEIMIGLEGFAEQHDAIRGAGTFSKTVDAIDLLVAERKADRYRGQVSINCVVSEPMVGHLESFVEHFEGRGVDAIYLSLLWYLSDDTSCMMDRYVASHLPEMQVDGRPSWHAYKQRLDPGVGEGLMDEFRRIEARRWQTRVRFLPSLELDEIPEFLTGSHRPAQGKTRCGAIHSRMDVMPNGDVVSCKFFPEFVVGNLGESDVAAAWYSEPFARVREVIDAEGLMPVCSKCSLLYARGV